MILGLDGREEKRRERREEEGKGEKGLKWASGDTDKYHFTVPDQTGTFCTTSTLCFVISAWENFIKSQYEILKS